MFGYIKPFKPEMKIREYTIFKSFYCGICKSLGHDYQQICRFGLNYDVTFLALLLSSLSKEKGDVAFERCIVNPFKKRPIVKNMAAVDYAAAVNVALFYYKMLDNWKDNRSFIDLAGMLILKPSFKKGMKMYSERYIWIQHQLKQLEGLEKEKSASIDKAAHPFAELLAGLVQFPDFSRFTNKTLRWLGYNLGKWVYILDAFADVPKDYKSKNYNVLIEKYGRNNSPDVILENSREEVEFILRTCIAESGKAYELLDVKWNQPILENIIFLGLPNKTQSILSDGREEHGCIQGTRGASQRHPGRDQKGLQGTCEEVPPGQVCRYRSGGSGQRETPGSK